MKKTILPKIGERTKRNYPLCVNSEGVLRHQLEPVVGNPMKVVSNDYKLVAEGTRHSVEFAAFLKEVLGQIPDSGFFA